MTATAQPIWIRPLLLALVALVALGAFMIVSYERQEDTHFRATASVEDQNHVAWVREELERLSDGTILKFRNGTSGVVTSTLNGRVFVRLRDHDQSMELPRQTLPQLYRIEGFLKPGEPGHSELLAKIIRRR